MITLIAAVAENNALGKDNQMIWHLPDDFKRFRQLTTGHYIIMGRKTFESLPKLLPNRTHVIISRQSDYQTPEGCIVVNALNAAIEACPEQEDVFIIGGGEIYKQAIAIADKIELTKVFTSPEADAFFPEIDPNEWQLVFEEFHSKDEKHAFDFSFLTYLKK
ncbi:dihydrofolate reductase [Flavobacterium inviolabile]|uniref:dihydrofolate reductase n=1 Tax=Flavobacterium inviolabile TaxID=2748320 RepID=UPI0015A97CA5|nr:dihydrofolate reductase [Flavobacterium inviolabile]